MKTLVRAVSVVALSTLAAPALANSARSNSTKPELGNISRVVLGIDVVTLAYPSAEGDAFDSLVRSLAKSLLSRRHIQVLEPDSTVEAPELIYYAQFMHDDECPDLVTVHFMLTLRDSVKVRNDRMGRTDSTLVLWEWWDHGGEVRFLRRTDMASELEDWVRQSTEAFLSDVAVASDESRAAKKPK